MTDTNPTFDDWLTYAFTRGYDDFHGHNPPPEPDSEEEARLYACQEPEPVLLAEFLGQLMDAPRILIDRFDRTQIANGIWYLFGIASESPRVAADPELPLDLRLRWLRGIPRLYREVFDTLCCDNAAEPDMPLDDGDALDSAVYMIWDMDQLLGACNTEDLAPTHLDIELCATILQSCRTSMCRLSALHGLGHCREHAEIDQDPHKVERVHQAIDAFLDSASDIPDHVRDYALEARDATFLL